MKIIITIGKRLLFIYGSTFIKTIRKHVFLVLNLFDKKYVKKMIIVQ